MTTLTPTSFHPTLKYTSKLPRSTLNVITTRNEAVLLEEAGTASVAYVSGLFPCKLLEASLFSESPCLPPVLLLPPRSGAPAPLIATIGFCHTTPIPFYLSSLCSSPCCVLLYTIYPAASDQYSIEWGSRKVVRGGRGDLTHWQHDWGIVLLAISFRFSRALLQYLVVIWFYTVNYVIHSYLN